MRPLQALLPLALALYASSCASPFHRWVKAQSHFGDLPVTREPTAPSHGPSEDTAVLPSDGFARAQVAFNTAADLDRAGILAEGAEGSGEIALTFDDGPCADTTTEVLRILSAHKVRATFFLTGRRLAGSGVVAELHRGIARAIVAGGHVIGNHALDHLVLDDKRGEAWCEAQIAESADRIAEATGVLPHYFRPPFGKLGKVAQRIVAARNDELVTWTIDAQDAQSKSTGSGDVDAERLARRLVAQLLFAGQGIVLLHDLRPSSVRALAILLDWLDAHPRNEATGAGFSVVDLPTYLAHAAARPYPQKTRAELLHARERMHDKRAF